MSTWHYMQGYQDALAGKDNLARYEYEPYQEAYQRGYDDGEQERFNREFSK